MLNNFSHAYLNQKTFRIIPSCYPPIALFEDLLDPSELESAYELESLTNDRLRDEVGDISLVDQADRVVGEGSSAIMAAFTHAGVASRFTDGRYGIYYAGLDLETALEESQHSRSSFLRATKEKSQVSTMRCYHCVIDAELVDVRSDQAVHDPNGWAAGQVLGRQLKDSKAYGAWYQSVRNPGGECVAVLRAVALKPPATQAELLQYHWNGEQQKITHVSTVRQK